MMCHENHPTSSWLRAPRRTRCDREEVRFRRHCPPARDLAEDEQETSLPSRQDFCRQELYGRNGEALTGLEFCGRNIRRDLALFPVSRGPYFQPPIPMIAES